ncbi:MAG TPA: hypothetical protein VGL81_15200 [Polyangiaceae bacterium]|jgi:hypothetical protein
MRGLLPALAGASTLALGCATRTTTSFSVRDPVAVALEAPDGRSLARTEGPPATLELLAHGEHHALFSDTAYDVFAERTPDGAIHVTCPACARAFQPPGTERVPLLGADRWTAPVAPEDVRAGPDALVLHERPCFLRGNKRCTAGAEAVLRIPWNDALVAREHTEPVRWVGGVAIAGGAPVILAGALDFALSPRDAPHGLEALGLGAVGVALVAMGLWYLLAPGIDDDVPATSYRP